MERRDFLRLGSACMLPTAFGMPNLGSRSRESTNGQRVSVAYLGDGESEETTRGGLMAADLLPAGDPAFTEHGARIEIHGLYPLDDPAAYEGLVAASVDVDYRPFQPVSFHAWSFEKILAPNVSGPSRFIVPIDKTYGLNLDVTFREMVEGVERSYDQRVRLTVCRERGLPKLRRGMYCIAFNTTGSSFSRTWAGYRLGTGDATNKTEMKRIYRSDWWRKEPRLVDFPYLLLSVEYSGSTEVEAV